jgi:glycosyltransferase involved in cell wall biosynthesis
MKITFVTANFQSLHGGVRAVAIYADLLIKMGHDVLVVSPKRPQPNLRQQVSSVLKGKGWIEPEADRDGYFHGLDVPRKFLDHAAPVTDADVPDADIVIACFWTTAEWVSNLSPAKGVKVYFVQHHELHVPETRDRAAATYRLPFHKIITTDWLADIMRTEYGDDRTSKVPYSVDFEQFNALPRGKQATPTVGMMYSTTGWKGCDISLKAFEIAARQVPNLRLIAMGFHQPSPDLPVPAGTEFIYRPPQHDLRAIYSQCDAWLFGSRVEGFGMPILEAMACRTPVIGTPAGAAPELLVDGAGLLVPLEDPEAMAQAIVRMCRMSDSQWRTISDRAYAKATDYSWDDAAAGFEAALYRAIDRVKFGNLVQHRGVDRTIQRSVAVR